MPNTKRDKYDEVRCLMMKLLRSLEKKDWIEAKAAWSDVEFALRDAFPPPAEDARQLAHLIMGSAVYTDGTELQENAWETMKEYNAAEIESFAQSRVEPWREALRMLVGLIDDGNHWDAWARGYLKSITAASRALLSDSPAKEATP